MSASSSLWLIPTLPLLGAGVNLFVGKRLGRSAGIVATVLVAASFAVSVAVVGSFLGLGAHERVQTQELFEWIRVGSFSVGATLRLDPLSATMILVVTGIGTLIHIYAIGYMRDDPRYGRFFAYMNLFVFFMLMLVLGQNLLVLYLGWEGVGLCSYLLIGFWFEKTENANAAKKAFVTTRIGDTAMLIGLALIAVKFGTLDYTVIFGAAGSTLTKSAATAIALLLFAGAVGKSAQVPLHVWLPDAMAGPTPVSALIHAATMVTAGVYLVLRMHVIFEISGVALTVVAIVGVVTMLFAGTCAFGQDDIKRVLAYSTISQLGFMFLAAGLKAYSIALFMLVAHAFYKALMFLGAGSVMHGMHDHTDMKQMGGLLRKMPVTGVTFIVGALALAGVYPLSGFFAKDEILEVASNTGHDLAVRPGCGRRVDLRAVHRPARVPHVLRPGTVGGGRARPRVPGHHDRPARAAGAGRGRGEPARSDDPRRPFDVPGARGRADARGHGRSPVRGDRRDLVLDGRGRPVHDVVRLRVRQDRLARAPGADAAGPARARARVVRGQLLLGAARHARQGRGRVAGVRVRRPDHRRHRQRDRRGCSERSPGADGGCRRVWSGRTRSRSWPGRSASSSTWGSGCDRSPADDRDVPAARGRRCS